MSKPFTVAIVGRPNVGKSRLFNRLVGKRVSIVHDMPGVTRDVVTRDLDGYTLMDTGGMGLASGQSGTPQNLIGAVEAQVELALAAADFVLMVVDGREGLVPLDYSMADKLRDANKPVALVVNKVDTPDARLEIDDFFALGMGDPLLVSAEHDRGIPELKKAIYERRDAMAECAQEAPAEDRKVIRVCFIGRPNVGKSSLSNCLVQSDRFIVSETPGTTRDSVEMPFAWKSKRGEDWHFALTDTAGICKLLLEFGYDCEEALVRRRPDQGGEPRAQPVGGDRLGRRGLGARGLELWRGCGLGVGDGGDGSVRGLGSCWLGSC